VHGLNEFEIKNTRGFNLSFFFKYASLERCLQVQHKLNLHRIGKLWKIIKGSTTNYIGIQKKERKRHGVVFPIFDKSRNISQEFYIYKTWSISKTLSIFKMRNKKILRTMKKSCFSSFHEGNQDRIIFLNTLHGVLALYLDDACLKYIYLTNTYMDEPKNLNNYFFRPRETRTEELSLDDDHSTQDEGYHEFKKMVLFKKDYLVIIDSYRIVVNFLDTTNSTPSITSYSIIKPYDIVTTITKSDKMIVLIGYKNFQLLEQDEKGNIKTVKIINHGIAFSEGIAGASILGNKIYVSESGNVYSVKIDDE